VYLDGGKALGIPAGIWDVPLSNLLFVGVSLLTKAPTAVADEFLHVANNSRKAARAVPDSTLAANGA
jgi:SSS family solute:Na+ symporter